MDEKQFLFHRQTHSTIISCELKNGVENSIIDKGASFNFDFGEGQEGVFLADADTQINRVVITDIKTIYKKNFEPFESKDYLDPFYFEVPFKTDVLKSIDKLKDQQESSFENFPMTFGTENENHCDLGFIISSPTLILEKGHQEIHLEFKLVRDAIKEDFNTAERNKFDQLLEREFELLLEKRDKTAKQQGELTEEDKKTEKKNLKESVERNFFRQAFNIFITTGDGWKQIKDSQTSKKDDIISICLPLKPKNDQLVSFDPSLHSGDYDTEWPCIKILLNNEATYHPYIFFKDCALECISILTEVSGVSNLKLSNSNGEIDCSIPFAPFGPIPEVGSYLRIQNPVIFQNHLSKLNLSIDWNGLPQLNGGFKKYYEAYQKEIDNNSFKAVIRTTRNLKRNTDTDKNKAFNLFKSTEYGDLKSEKVLEIELGDFEINNKIIQSKGGFVDNSSLYLILKEPDIAFGHDVFPQIYAKTAMRNTRYFRKKTPLPNQPYLPVIDRLTVNYSNKVKENVLVRRDKVSSHIKLFHVYPFGQEMVFPGPVKSPLYLFPQINKKGNVYIGLKDVFPNDIISIGFDLIPAVYNSTAIKIPKVTWKYLCKNEWLDLTELVVKDGTKGLIKSGIVKIQVPHNILVDSTIFESGKFWIKAEFDGLEDINSRIKNAFTQAISLTSKTNTQTTIPIKNLQNHTINITTTGNHKIEKIRGPINYKTQQDIEENNIKEQLQHQNRAVSNNDIERIILDKFKQLKIIGVFRNNKGSKELSVGDSEEINLIPIKSNPDQLSSEGHNLDIDTLKQIKVYILKFVSPNVKIEVYNPVFKWLKVSCRVQFEDDQNLAAKLNQDLITYLSPRSSDFDKDSLFEISFKKTDISNFIEERPYVKILKEFSVIRLVKVEGSHRIMDTKQEKDILDHTKGHLKTISAYRPIFISAPQHHIEILRPEVEEDGIKGIDDLAIESDFIITKETDVHNIYIEDNKNKSKKND